MIEPGFEQASILLPQIASGEVVYDRDQREIGKVVLVNQGRSGVPEEVVVAKGLSADRQLAEVPQEMAQRLAPHGFIEIAAGPSGSHRYAASDQILAVDWRGVHLGVAERELLTTPGTQW